MDFPPESSLERKLVNSDREKCSLNECFSTSPCFTQLKTARKVSVSHKYAINSNMQTELWGQILRVKFFK